VDPPRAYPYPSFGEEINISKTRLGIGHGFEAGLPDGTYISETKIPIWVNLQVLATEGVSILSVLWLFGIFRDHLVYFVAIWYILYPFWYVVPTKSGNPESDMNLRNGCGTRWLPPDSRSRAPAFPRSRKTGRNKKWFQLPKFETKTSMGIIIADWSLQALGFHGDRCYKINYCGMKTGAWRTCSKLMFTWDSFL
jgi:hypothetical protein